MYNTIAMDVLIV